MIRTFIDFDAYHVRVIVTDSTGVDLYQDGKLVRVTPDEFTTPEQYANNLAAVLTSIYGWTETTERTK